MPELNVRDRPDLDDLADDFVRTIEDEKVQATFYRITEKLKAIIAYQQEIIETLYRAVTDIEDQL